MTRASRHSIDQRGTGALTDVAAGDAAGTRRSPGWVTNDWSIPADAPSEVRAEYLPGQCR